MKQPLRTLLPVLVAIVVSAAPAADAVAAELTLSRQDRQGPVTVTATLLPPVPADGLLRVKVALDTHSVNLDDLAFENIVALRVPDGSDVEPIAIEQAKGGGHHREAVVVFPVPGAGGGPRVVVVKNVGGVRERIFTWDLPASR